jgi:hypothetical protein
MSTQRNADDTGIDHIVIAAVAADHDLVAERDGYQANDDSTHLLPKEIVVIGAGNLVVRYEGAGADADTIPAPANSVWGIGPRTIDATTTATNIVVIY